MSTNTSPNTGDIDLRSSINEVMEGNHVGHGDKVYRGLTTEWGLPEVVVGRGGQLGVPTGALREKVAENPEWLEERYGSRHPFLAAAMADDAKSVRDSDMDTKTANAIRALMDPEDSTRDADFDAETRATVDDGIISDAAPVEVDPMIVDVQRSAAPELEVITTVAQPGYSYQYNVISNRDAPVGFLSNDEAHGDLESQFSNQSFTLSDETVSHTRQVGLIKVADFSQRAMESLNYMDPRETTLGQALIAHRLQQARALFYGDPDQGAGDRSIEDADAPRGLARFAEQAGNTTSKSSVSSGFMEDLLNEATTKIQNSGLTWDRARFFVSPFMYNALYEEATPVVRLDGYDADVEFGPQGIALSTEQGTIPFTYSPNIRSYSGFNGLAGSSDPGDVFLVDDLAIQKRQLAPQSTVSLGRTGLADRVALFEYYSFCDKSLDTSNSVSHTEYLQAYDLPNA
jgi:hypothetical protein